MYIGQSHMVGCTYMLGWTSGVMYTWLDVLMGHVGCIQRVGCTCSEKYMEIHWDEHTVGGTFL